MGPYPRSKTGNSYIFVVLDHVTKFVLLKALPSATTPRLVKYLKDDEFLLFGTPETIHMDNGSQFKSKMFKNLLPRFDVKHKLTAVNSPQSNASERVNRSVLAAIRTYVGNDHRNCDAHLGEIACALRNSFHQSSKNSPYYTMFGLHMITQGSNYNLLRDLKKMDDPDIQLPLADRLQVI